MFRMEFLCSLLDEQLYTEYQDPFSNDEYAKYLIYNDDEGKLSWWRNKNLVMTKCICLKLMLVKKLKVNTKVIYLNI